MVRVENQSYKLLLKETNKLKLLAVIKTLCSLAIFVKAILSLGIFSEKAFIIYAVIAYTIHYLVMVKRTIYLLVDSTSYLTQNLSVNIKAIMSDISMIIILLIIDIIIFIYL